MQAETPPFFITEGDTDVRNELRMRYRYLDLRRPEMMKNIIARSEITKLVRDYYHEKGFIEIETPNLIKPTPEGARDYLVPSRIFPGNFFALPQSPQLYKQLIMYAGFDRYIQIARCYLDQDLRADRQPEFTQIDMDMSFVTEDDVMDMNEGLIHYLYKKFLGVTLPEKFPRIKYAEAMERFGSDKPDIRFGFELCNLTDLLKDCTFRFLKEQLLPAAAFALSTSREVQASPAAKSTLLVRSQSSTALRGLHGAKKLTARSHHLRQNSSPMLKTPLSTKEWTFLRAI